jgi:hypothetical protein
VSAVRKIVRAATHEYNRHRVSVQPSASAVDETAHAKTPSPSGRLLLRMPPGLHAAVTRAAERDGVSLNGFITARLTESVGWTAADENRPDTTAEGPAPSRTLVWLLAANVAAVGLAAVAAVVILLVAWLG